MVAFGCVLCTIEGWSLVQVIQSNVAKMNEGKCGIQASSHSLTWLVLWVCSVVHQGLLHNISSYPSCFNL